MKKIITQSEKLQLLGLVTLGRQHSKMQNAIQDAVSKITGVQDSMLHDATWDFNIDFDDAFDQSFSVEDDE